jgi:pimeloyl-ACP methyl ester carboxylesterase
MDVMTGLARRTVRANGIRINLWAGGKGPPVLLLHGWPQTAQMWHKIAPALAAWAKGSRLNPLAGLVHHRDNPAVVEDRERIKRHGAAAAANLAKLIPSST